MAGQSGTTKGNQSVPRAELKAFLSFILYITGLIDPPQIGVQPVYAGREAVSDWVSVWTM